MTIDKGQKNTQLLIQPQYSPMSVEKQIAILYCGTHGLLRNVPIDKVKQFEADFLRHLEMNNQADVLDQLKAGKLDDKIESILKEVAANTAAQFKK